MMITAEQDMTAPSVPTNLVASNITATTFTLSWTGSTDTGGSGLLWYGIYKNGLIINYISATTYNATVNNGSSNTWAVSALDHAGNESSLSTDLVVTMLDTEAPSEPTNIGWSFPSNTELNLYWTASTDYGGISGYRVYKNGSYVKAVPNTSYIFSGLIPGESNNWAVQAEDNFHNLSTYNNEVVITQPGGGL